MKRLCLEPGCQREPKPDRGYCDDHLTTLMRRVYHPEPEPGRTWLERAREHRLPAKELVA